MKKKGFGPKKLSSLSFWGKSNISNWLSFFSDIAPSETKGWKISSGISIKGCCPFHDDKTPSFYITPSRGIAKCFSSECGKAFTNPARLIKELIKCPQNDAIKLLRDKLDIKAVSNTIVNELDEEDRKYEVKRKFFNLCHNELLEHINNPKSERYRYAKEAATWLRKTRSLKNIEYMDVGVSPPTDIICSSLGDAVVKELHECNPFYGREWVGSCVFKYTNDGHNISELRIRKLSQDKVITSLWRTDNEDVGFFGLMQYQHLLGKENMCILVEGEFDQLTLFDGQINIGDITIPVISYVGNSNASNVDRLSDLGIKTCYIIADHPDAKGNESVETILKNSVMLNHKVYGWPSNLPGQDPDQAVALNSFTDMWESFTDWEGAYYSCGDWFLERIRRESLGKEDGVKIAYELTVKFSRILVNSSDRTSFLHDVEAEFNVLQSEVRKDVEACREDAEGFVERLKIEFLNTYDVVGLATDDGNKLKVWSKDKKEYRDLPVARMSEVENLLSIDLGTLTNWVTRTIGIPDFIEFDGFHSDTDFREKRSLLQQERLIRDHLLLSFKNILKDTKSMAFMNIMSQGIHIVEDRGQIDVYYINGNIGFHGSFNDEKVLIWNTLSKPVHRNNCILYNDSKWSKVVNVETLNLGSKVDIVETFEKVEDIIIKGWDFYSPSEAKFLAAYITLSPIFSVMKRQTLIGIHADMSSGKSKLSLGLIAGKQSQFPGLIEHVLGTDNISAAGLQQELNNQYKLVVLDEFEDKGNMADPKTRRTKEIMNLFRSVSSSSADGVAIYRGTPSGGSKKFTFRCPAIFVGIRPPSEGPDVSRIIPLKLKRTPNRPAPERVIAETYNHEDLIKLRTQIMTGMFSHIQGVVKEENYLRARLIKDNSEFAHTYERFLDNMYPILALMKHMGMDYVQFLKEFIHCKSDYLSEVGTTSSSNRVWEEILRSPSLDLRMKDKITNKASVLAMLRAPEYRTEICKTQSGVYYYEGSVQIHGRKKAVQWLFVVWTEAVQGVLSNSDLRFESPHSLKAQAEQKKGVVPANIVKKSGSITRACGSGNRIEDLSVLDVSSLMEEIQNDIDMDICEYKGSGV